MKKRIRKVANFLAFNLLFFALYLNFIHNDKQNQLQVDRSMQPAAAAFSGTVLVQNPEKYLAPGESGRSTLAGGKPETAKHAIN